MKIIKLTSIVEEFPENVDIRTVTDAAYLLLYKMLVESKTRKKATKETIEQLDTATVVIIDALEKLDAYLLRKYSDKPYHMVCLKQLEWGFIHTTCMELIDEGFKIQEDPSGKADFNVSVDNGFITAKLFEHESSAIKFLYESYSIISAEVQPKTLLEAIPA